MTRGRILTTLLIALLAVPAVEAGTLDAFLEELRVGSIRDPDTIAMEGPWPRDLFTSLTAVTDARSDTAEPAAAGIFVTLADQILSGGQAREAWVQRFRSENDTRMRRRIGSGTAWREGRFADCAEDCRAVLAEPDLDPESTFVWSLRLRAAEDPDGHAVTTLSGLWPELLELDSFDLQTGWDLWTAQRRILGLPILPDTFLSDDEVGWLMRLRKSYLSARDIDRARITSPQRAALGAACLDTPSLVRHFGLYPEPPGDASLAAAWARGAWRRSSHTVTAAEHLGSLGALPWTVRADFWRRAGDKHVSSGRWVEGEAALAEAVTLARRSGQRSTLRRVGEECGRAAALARHQGRNSLATVFSAWALELDPVRQPDATVVDIISTVRAGEAPAALESHGIDFETIVANAQMRVWELWRGLGLRLASQPDAGEIGSVYAAALAQDDPAHAVAVILGTHDLRDDVLGWAYRLDREQSQGENAPVDESPVPAWSSRLGAGPGEQLVRHALFGVCMLTGDTRGRLACAVSLPRPGLSAAENLLILYPLPARSSIVEAIQASPDPALVLAVARNESLFDPGVRSRAGALGWMQVMPFHFVGNGVEAGVATWRIPANSVRKGLNLLKENRRRYNGDPYRILAAYNAGPGAVTRWARQMGGSPSRADFLAWIGYPETRRYVEQVLMDRQIYAQVLREFAGEGTTEP